MENFCCSQYVCHPINCHQIDSTPGCSNICLSKVQSQPRRWSYNFADFGLVRLKHGRLSTTIILILPGRNGFLQSTVTGALKPIIGGDRAKPWGGGRDLGASLQYFLNFYFLLCFPREPCSSNKSLSKVEHSLLGQFRMAYGVLI